LKPSTITGIKNQYWLFTFVIHKIRPLSGGVRYDKKRNQHLLA
jgi:hypothetical protein